MELLRSGGSQGGGGAQPSNAAVSPTIVKILVTLLVSKCTKFKIKIQFSQKPERV